MPKRKDIYDHDDITRAFSLLVTNPKFLKSFLPSLDPKIFTQPELRWTTDTIVRYANERSETDLSFIILASMLRNDRELKDEEKEIIAPFITAMSEKRPKKREVAYFTDVFESFIKRCFVKGVLQDAARLLNEGQTEAAEDTILKMKMPTAFREDIIFAPYDWDILFQMQSEEELAKSIPTGIKGIDKVITGLQPGEEGVIMAPLGYGKSMTLVAFGAHAWKKGKHVIHFTMENSAKETLARYVSNMTGIPRHELKEEEGATDKLRRVEALSDKKGGIIAIERCIGSMTNIRTLEASIIAIENQYDFKTDLVMIDYGDLMTPLKSSGGRKYEDMQNVFSEIRDLAATCEVPIWTATQTNRIGLESKRVRTAHIADSLGKAMTADLIIGFSRPEKDAEKDADNVLTGDVCEFQILKNRRGDEPRAPFKAVTNFALSRFDPWDEDHQDAAQDAADDSAKKKYKTITATKTMKAAHGK